MPPVERELERLRVIAPKRASWALSISTPHRGAPPRAYANGLKPIGVLAPTARASYPSGVAASSLRVRRIVELVDELDADERAELELQLLDDVAEALDRQPPREETLGARHELIAQRVARVHAGEPSTLSLDEVERSLRADLDF